MEREDNERSEVGSGAITLTFGDCAENHKGMQVIGEQANEGFTKADLVHALRKFGKERCELVRLRIEVHRMHMFSSSEEE